MPTAPPHLSIGDLAKAQVLGELSNQTDQAEGEDRIGLLAEQQAMVFEDHFAKEYFGEDPMGPGPGWAAHQEVIYQKLGYAYLQKDAQVRDAMQQGGWDEIEQFGNSIVSRYKERNGAELVHPQPGMSPEVIQQLSEQFTPIQIPEVELSEWRQRLVQLDQLMQGVDSSVWSDPRTARIAKIIAGESEGLGRPGLVSGAPTEMEMGVGTRAAVALYGGAEAFLGGAAQVGVGARHAGEALLYKLGLLSLDSMSAGNSAAYHAPATHFVQDSDGQVYHNGGKVGGAEFIGATWHLLTNQRVDEEVAKLGASQQRYLAEAKGFDSVVYGVSQFMGSMTPFLAGGGPAMAGGSAMMKGLANTVKLSHLPRTQKMISLMARTSGAAGGLGTYEAVVNGNVEGYGAAFIHGAMMAPPMMAMGWMGHRTEQWLRRRNMPKPLSKLISGSVEGMGFAALDPNVRDSLWAFLKDPNSEDLGEFSKGMLINMLGMGAMKTFGLPTPSRVLPKAFGEAAEAQALRGEARRVAAEKTVEPEVAAQKAEQAGVSRETFTEYGETLRELREVAGKEPERARELVEETRRLEERLEVEEARLEKTEVERREERQVEREREPEKELQLQAAIQEAKDAVREAKTPEARKEALAEVRRLEAEMPGRDVKEIAPGMELEFRPSADRPGAQEWLIRSKEGEVIGHGQFQIEGKRADLWSADVAEPYQGRGLYGSVLKELHARFPEGVTSPGGQTGGAEGAWKKAGLEPPPETLRLEAAELPEPIEGRPKSLQVRPELQREPVEGVEPIRAKDVLLEMEGFEGDPIRPKIGKGVGRAAKAVKGLFKALENLIRLRGARDVVTGAHEWSHAMQKETFGLDWIPKDQKLIEDFATAASTYPGYKKLKPKERVAEGWAEFWARDLLGDPRLKEEVPYLHDWAMKWMSKPEQAAIRTHYQRIKSALQRWRDIGAVERTRQTMFLTRDKPSIQEKKANPPLRKLLEKLDKALLDDLAGLKASQRKWMEIAGVTEKDLPITSNPYRILTTLRMNAARQAEHFLRTGTQDLAGNKTGESLADVFKDISREQYENFLTYLVARRSLEIQDKGMETQLAREDYLATVEILETPAFRQAAKRVREWSKRLIDYVTEAGGFTDKEAQHIKDSYEIYIPFQRVLEGPRKVSPTRGVAERGTGVKKMKGAQEEIRDPIDAMADMTQSMIAKAHQTMAVKALYKLGIQAEKIGGLISEVERDAVPKEYRVDDIAAALKKQVEGAEEMAEGLKEAFSSEAITLFSQQVVPTGSRPIIAYTPKFTEAEIAAEPNPRAQARMRKDNGKLKWFEVDVEAYEALMGVEAMPGGFFEKMPLVQTLMEAPASILRYGATVLSPGFAVRNALKDMRTQPLYTTDGSTLNPLAGTVAFIRGSKEIFQQGKAAELFQALGGEGATFFGAELKAGRASREIAGTQRGPIEAVRHIMGKYVDALSKTEQVLRIEEFKKIRNKALKEGKSELEANLEALEAAKEITVNFTRAGSVARPINRVITYFTAGIAGSRKFLRHTLGFEGARAQRRAITAGLTNITALSAINYLMHGDEDWYQDLPAWQRVNWWTFKLPGTDQPIALPKPHEAGLLFTLPFEIAIDHLMQRNPVETKEALLAFAGNLMNGFSFIPIAIQPTIEVMSNYRFFAGKEIVPGWMERARLPEDQFHASTTRVAQWLGESFGVSPLKIQHWLGAHTGGMMTNMFRTVEEIAGMNQRQGTGLENMPVIGTLLRQQPHEQSRYVQDVYKLRDLLKRKEGSDKIEGWQRPFQPQLNAAISRFAAIRKAVKAGQIDKDVGDRQMFEIARPLIEAYRRRQ